MDGVVAYLLSRKFTKDTVIGMGAIKGAPCQVQSINKVGKTTTITLKWEDNLGTPHTQDFEVEDGADGVSVINANINTNGNLIITLSNGNDIDCGKVLPQYDTLPSATSSNVGQILQYIGVTNANYTHGYYYECVNDGGVYKWQYINVQDSYTKEQIGSLSDLPDITKNVILNIADLSSAIDDKEDIFRYSSLPSPTSTNVGKIAQYIGTTTVNYINGYYYQCVESPVGSGTYIWVQKNVQPNNGGGGGDGVVDGYYNSTDQLFYEDSAFLNPIAGEDNTIYVDLNTNGLYRYNGAIFIKVSSSAESIQVDTMPTASDDELGNIYQFIGTTTVDYTNGYFYKCVEDGGVYSWENINTQNSYNKDEVYNRTEIGDISNLPDSSKDIVENISDLDNNKENVFRYAHSVDIPTASIDNVGTIIQYIGTTTADYINGYFYECVLNTDTSTYEWQNIDVQPASGISAVDSVNGKTGTVVLDAKDIGLQASTMPNADLDHVNQVIQYVGTTGATYINGYWYKCVYDSVGGTYSWEQLNVQPHITVDSTLSDTSENPVQNKVINSALAGKAGLALPSAANNFATLDASGDLTDSGISKDIVPSGAASNNKLVTASDISTLTNKANKVSPAPSVSGNIATLDTNGDLTDSGINKNIIPADATSTDKLAKLSDIPTELNDLSDDVVITNPQNNQIFAYNSTSGKWENKTGQETIGGLVFKGSILFANLPTTGMANGDAYDIKDAFTTDNRFEEGSGIDCGAGTDVVWVASENKWNILTPSGVYSFNGRTGAVSPATSDYDADQIDYDNTTSGLTATDVQAAIDENASDISSHTSNTNNPHSVTASQVGLGNVVNTGDSDTPVSGGTTKFTTGGAYTELNKKADKVASATNGHLAGLDSNGNLTDSNVVANDVIQKVATATGLLKDDGSVDTTNYAPSDKAYLTDDTAETTIDDADYFPFYDTSATGKRKTLFSSIVNKLKATFATLVTGTFTSGNLVSLDSSGNISDSGKKASDFQTVSLADFTGDLNTLTTAGYKQYKAKLSDLTNAPTVSYTPMECYIDVWSDTNNIYQTIRIVGLTYSPSAKYSSTFKRSSYNTGSVLSWGAWEQIDNKISIVSGATQNDIAIFDANGGVADSNVSIINAKVEANGTSESHINLNDYKTAGTYFWNPLDVTTTDNAPSGINQSNSLLVVSLRGVSTGSVVELTQTFYHRNSQGIYVRYCYSSNNWTTWKKLSYSNEVATIAPTPASGLTESDIVDAVNVATATNANAPSLYGVQQWTNEKKVRRVLNGANIPSGVTANATGIGTWDDTEPPTETDWWYDAAFVVPVYYRPTTDTVIVTDKTYYTQSGTAPNYTYTAVANPVVADIGSYYEQYSDDVEISIKFDPSGDTTVLGGYILDTTTGKICIKFANSIDITKARIAVDLTYTRNEVS